MLIRADACFFALGIRKLLSEKENFQFDFAFPVQYIAM